MKVWITGTAGFLGSHLREELVALGHDVGGNDNFICSSDPSYKSYALDCRDFYKMRDVLEQFNVCAGKKIGIDVLVHCAATAHEGLSHFSPSFVTQNIYEASVATFSAAIAAGVKRIVFMSSMARYGNGLVPFEEFDIPRPVDPYGIAKVAAEDTLRSLCRLHDVEYVILVPHNIIGARQKYDDPARNVASIMINRALKGQDLIVYGDGEQKRCFSPIKDCLHSLIRALDAPISGEIINIGPERDNMTITGLARMIITLTGAKVDIQHFPDRPGEVKEAYCSNEKARRLLGFKSQQSVRECLEDMIKYIKQHGTKDFNYFFPIEIRSGKTPETWTRKLI